MEDIQALMDVMLVTMNIDKQTDGHFSETRVRGDCFIVYVCLPGHMGVGKRV
jgi:hypothetical protein